MSDRRRVRGVAINESLQDQSVLEAVDVIAVEHRDAGDVNIGQPERWTLTTFEALGSQIEQLAHQFSRCLMRGPWYVDFHSDQEVFVVFARNIFRYSKGDPAGRAAAEEFGRSAGVPEDQLDWDETY